MPIDYAALPLAPPPALPTTATDALRAEWRDLHRIAASYAQAAAQQASAEATDRMVTAQAAFAASIGASPAPLLPAPVSLPRKPTRAELAFELLKTYPQATILTNSQLVTGAAGMVDAFVAKYPQAVQD